MKLNLQSLYRKSVSTKGLGILGYKSIVQNNTTLYYPDRYKTLLANGTDAADYIKIAAKIGDYDIMLIMLLMEIKIMSCCEVISMIVDIVATLATVAAVLVALWQTKVTNKKSVSISSTNVCMMKQYANGKVDNTAENGIRIKVVNTGNRRIVINDIGVYIDKDFSLQVLELTDSSFPKTIDIEEYFNFTITLSSLHKALNSNLESLKKLSSKIRFYVTDSTGKKYFCKYCRSFDAVLKMSDSDFVISI